MAGRQFEFVRLVDDERRVGPTLASVSKHWKQDEACFLFLSPHDDDVVIGGGLTILSAVAEKVPVHVAVVTDGAMGYCSTEEKDSIGEIRRKETYAACRTLGVKRDNVHWLGFPDCQLPHYQGRRRAAEDDPVQSWGYTGLQHSFTEVLRRVRPNQVFVPTSADLHPDHRIVYSELMISIFHACGAIWPELGEPLAKAPFIHEMAVYCNFPEPPKLRIRAPKSAFDKKLKAIGQFQSQKQIDKMVDMLEAAGPMEYLRPIEFGLYDPRVYRRMFEEPTAMPTMFR